MANRNQRPSKHPLIAQSLMATSRKRAATSTTDIPSGPLQSTSGTSISEQATKKIRFLEPEDDPANFEEQVEGALEDPLKSRSSRKRSIRNEGYESDSTDDGEGVVMSRRPGEEDEEGMDDMFAAATDAEVIDSKGKSKGKSKVGSDDDDYAGPKKEKYLRLGDIEGQEFGNDEGGLDYEGKDKRKEKVVDDESGSDEDDEPEDEDDAENRKKAGMGYELTSFNMREEMEEGKFTEDGSYVKSYDAHAMHDRWMEGLDEKEIKAAKKSKKRQERLQREKLEREERELAEGGGKMALEMKMLAFLKKGETVLEALQRLGVLGKRLAKTQKQLKPGATTNIDNISPTQIDKEKPKPLTDIEELTHLASTLMSLGDTDIYSRTYEEIVRAIRSSGDVEQTWEPPSADVKYEYKWATGTNKDIFGPFSEEEMRGWHKASYFGAAGEMVEVRQLGGEWGGWDDLLG